MLMYLISFCLTAKVTISPYEDKFLSLSYSKLDNNRSIFNFQTVYRQDLRLLHCTTPILAPIVENKFRIYFCGKLMHLKNYNLQITSILNQSSIFELIPHKKYFLIKNSGKCMEIFKQNIYFKECDTNKNEQLFIIKLVKAPLGYNLDLTLSRRESNFENKEIIYDEAMRQFSKIKHSEYIFDNIQQNKFNSNLSK